MVKEDQVSEETLVNEDLIWTSNIYLFTEKITQQEPVSCSYH